jgi:Lrp/AsnC family transcriptional regulator, leucine-responsive regulatory protein
MNKNGNHKVIDDLNWSILEELQKNARLSTTEIGRRIGLSAPAVADRIEKMEELGIIKGYHTLLDYDKLDLTIRAFILFKNNNLKHAELIKLVDSIPEVMEWHTITGSYAVLLKIATNTSERLAKIIEQLEENGETNTSLILSKSSTSSFIKKRT